jgi:ribosome-binding protein aMBF1 (putative translation factor)
MDAKKIRVALARADVQANQFAEMAHIHVSALSDFMHGRYTPGPEVRSRLQAALDELERNPPARRVLTRGVPRKTEVAS